ncbi:MAG: DsrE family protein [Aquificota bacterium]|nr:DsrE family protein [Aquificota bacterium]
MDRRSFFKIGAAAVALTAADKMASAANVKLRFEDMKKEAKINVIYHADFPQEKRFKTMLRNITNHLSVYDFDPFKIKIVVVSHGREPSSSLRISRGTKWAKEPIDQKALRTKMEELLQYGVEFYVCGITVKRAKLVGKLYDFVKIVPSGVGTVAHLQTLGYAYIKVQ